MSRPKVPVILFGGSPVSALGFARSLARNGVPVYYVTSTIREATFHCSRYLKQVFVVPDVETNVEKTADFLVRFQKKHNFAVIFPGSDSSCLNLASVKVRLDESTRERFCFLLPQKEIVETLINKRKFYNSISNQEIPHPITYCPENLDDVAKISHEVDYPVYLKPSLTSVFESLFKVKGFVAKSKEELTGYYSLAAKHGLDVLIQEIIPGSDNQVFGINAYFDKKNNPRGLFAYRRIRGYPRNFGVGTLIESIGLLSVPELKALVNYLHRLGYHGLVDAEFKRDPRDGTFKFLEVNPRVWLQNSFPARCGINLNLIAYLDAINNPITPNGDFRTGFKWMNLFGGDLMRAIEMLHCREMSASEWGSSLFSINDWAYSPFDDFFPWILNFLFTLREFLLAHVSARSKQSNSARE